MRLGHARAVGGKTGPVEDVRGQRGGEKKKTPPTGVPRRTVTLYASPSSRSSITKTPRAEELRVLRPETLSLLPSSPPQSSSSSMYSYISNNNNTRVLSISTIKKKQTIRCPTTTFFLFFFFFPLDNASYARVTPSLTRLRRHRRFGQRRKIGKTYIRHAHTHTHTLIRVCV